MERAGPWRLARAERDGDDAAGARLDDSLALPIGTCAQPGRELAPFLPGLAAQIQATCDDSAGSLPAAQPVSRGCAEAGRKLRSATSAGVASAHISAWAATWPVGPGRVGCAGMDVLCRGAGLAVNHVPVNGFRGCLQVARHPAAAADRERGAYLSGQKNSRSSPASSSGSWAAGKSPPRGIWVDRSGALVQPDRSGRPGPGC